MIVISFITLNESINTIDDENSVEKRQTMELVTGLSPLSKLSMFTVTQVSQTERILMIKFW